jgi:hypothetical protein
MSEFLARVVAFAVCLLLLAPALLPSRPVCAADTPQTFSHEQLDQLTAPIALYPDSLLSQVLMAATYPADVEDAATWSKANPNQKGDAAVKAVDSESWDPSVKSLVAFPQVLAMMGEKPDWVQNLGDAFLASSKDVLDSVQRLRAKAKEAGNLKSNDQQKVVVTPAESAAPAQSTTTTTVTAPPAQVIVIESADPEVVYVPSYNPTVVYGPWPYPAYPPYYYPPPPMYYPGAALASGIAFGIGVAAVGSLWGDCNWGGGDVDIDVNRYNNINANNKINSDNRANAKNKFQHNAANRRGVPYRDANSQRQYGKSLPGAEGRSDFRGRDPARESQRRNAQQSLEQRGMDPGKGRDQLRNDPQTRERAQNAARDTGRQNSGRDRNDGLDRSRGDGANRDLGADNRNRNRSPGGASQRDFKQSPAERDIGSRSGTERARGASDNAFRNSDNAARSRQQIDRGSSSRQQMQRSGGGMQRGGGGMRGGGGGGRR